jgi:nucleoid-associated protein YgaU
MSIKKGSRYEYSTVDFLEVKTDGSQSPIVFYEFPATSTISYYEHTYVKGERLDQISQQYYNKPTLWWLIMDYNPQITNPLQIKTGTVIKVPRV